jgi:hypothetical protein
MVGGDGMHGCVESDAEWVGGKMDYGKDYWYVGVRGARAVLVEGDPIEDGRANEAQKKLYRAMERKWKKQERREQRTRKERQERERAYFVGMLDAGD